MLEVSENILIPKPLVDSKYTRVSIKKYLFRFFNSKRNSTTITDNGNDVDKDDNNDERRCSNRSIARLLVNLFTFLKDCSERLPIVDVSVPDDSVFVHSDVRETGDVTESQRVVVSIWL